MNRKAMITAASTMTYDKRSSGGREKHAMIAPTVIKADGKNHRFLLVLFPVSIPFSMKMIENAPKMKKNTLQNKPISSVSTR